jgi:hypothetical protein
MPGVFRPYTVSDIIGSLADQIGAAASGNTTATGTGHFTEADEALGVTGTATVTAQANPGWDAGQWGQFTWG